jgi:alkylation response protein AidB-like acyl-CoA dehydrogenase
MLAELSLTHIPAEDESLRSDVRKFLARTVLHIPPEQRARSWMGFDAEFSRLLAEQGWIGLTLPKKYGGADRSAFARFVLVEELLAVGAPVSAHWIADRQSEPLILHYGTETQREFYLPKICRGEIFFCIGMSESNAGSDLVGVQARAEKLPGGGLRIRGTKIWTTNAHGSQYIIVLVRTSGTASDRHNGLTQFIVDLSLPGIEVRAIKDQTGDAHFNEVVFNEVVVPGDALIGQEGAGWAQVTAELAFERSGPERILSSIVLVDEWLDWLREQSEPSAEGLQALGKISAKLQVLRAMSISLTGMLSKGMRPVIEAALVKDLGTALEQDIPHLIANSIGSHPFRRVPDRLLRTMAYVTQIAPTYSLRGGTREILRGMIARGLGLR